MAVLCGRLQATKWLIIAYVIFSTFLNIFLLLHKDAFYNDVHGFLSRHILDSTASVGVVKIYDIVPPQAAIELPTIYMITPTHARRTQKVDLTRLAQTLRHVPNFHWIVVEDARQGTSLVAKTLQRSGVNYTHLVKLHPDGRLKPKGVKQRNAGLDWLREQFRASQSLPRGIVYFGDDDNAYDLRLFELMRTIEGIGVWPVAFCGGLAMEKPVVSKEKVIGWDVYWAPERPFATDMAGFAINLNLILSNPRVEFEFKDGLESVFLSRLGFSLRSLEPINSQSREALVWHVRTEIPSMVFEENYQKKHNRSSDVGWEI